GRGHRGVADQASPPCSRRKNRGIDAAGDARPAGMAKIPLKLEEIVDRATLRREIAALVAKTGSEGARPGLVRLLKDMLAKGRATAETMLHEDGGGNACAARLSHLMDEVIRVLY